MFDAALAVRLDLRKMTKEDSDKKVLWLSTIEKPKPFQLSTRHHYVCFSSDAATKKTIFLT